MQIRAAVLGALVASASALGAKKMDDNPKVFIANLQVLGVGAGVGVLGVCRELAEQHVSNPDAPNVKVCGTGIFATFYLRGQCEAYYERSRKIGQCNTGMTPSNRDSYGPSQDLHFGHYQSNKIEQCPPR